MNIADLISKLQALAQSDSDLPIVIFDRTNDINLNFISVGYNEENDPCITIVVAQPTSNILFGLPPGGLEYINRPESGVRTSRIDS